MNDMRDTRQISFDMMGIGNRGPQYQPPQQPGGPGGYENRLGGLQAQQALSGKRQQQPGGPGGYGRGPTGMLRDQAGPIQRGEPEPAKPGPMRPGGPGGYKEEIPTRPWEPAGISAPAPQRPYETTPVEALKQSWNQQPGGPGGYQDETPSFGGGFLGTIKKAMWHQQQPGGPGGYQRGYGGFGQQANQLGEQARNFDNMLGDNMRQFSQQPGGPGGFQRGYGGQGMFNGGMFNPQQNQFGPSVMLPQYQQNRPAIEALQGYLNQGYQPPSYGGNYLPDPRLEYMRR